MWPVPTTLVAAQSLVPRTPQQAWPGVLYPAGVPRGIEGDIATGGVWRCQNCDPDKDPCSSKTEPSARARAWGKG